MAMAAYRHAGERPEEGEPFTPGEWVAIGVYIITLVLAAIIGMYTGLYIGYAIFDSIILALKLVSITFVLLHIFVARRIAYGQE